MLFTQNYSIRETYSISTIYFAHKNTIDKVNKNTEEENIGFYLQSVVP